MQQLKFFTLPSFLFILRLQNYCAYCFLLFGKKESWASQVVLVVKNPPAKAGDVRDTGSIPGSGRSPGVANGNPLHYSCLKNPTDRGGGLQSTGSQRVGHNWSDLAHTHTHSQTMAYKWGWEEHGLRGQLQVTGHCHLPVWFWVRLLPS